MPRLHKRTASRTCLDVAALENEVAATTSPPAPCDAPGADQPLEPNAGLQPPTATCTPLCACFLSSSPRRRLLDATDVPRWRRLPFITSGYRVEMTRGQALATALTLHNQTGNIVTHLVPAVLFVALAPVLAYEWGGDAYFRDAYDVALFAVFYLCVSYMLVVSTLYHVFECVSERVHDAFFSCDLCGIALCVLSLCYLHIWHCFRFGLGGASWAHSHLCASGTADFASALAVAEKLARARPAPDATRAAIAAYFKPAMALLCTMSSAAMTYISAHPAQYFLRPRTLLMGFYGMTATCYLLVFTHLLATLAYADSSGGLAWPKSFDPDGVLAFNAVISLATITTGCTIFNLKWPEVLAPGLFDLLGNSHQLWHIACTLAPFVMFHGTVACAHAMERAPPCVSSPSSLSA